MNAYAGFARCRIREGEPPVRHPDHLDHPDHPHCAVRRAERDLLAALRRCGADPHVARAAKGLSWTGEHGAVWLAAGLAGAAADRDRRAAWLRATALVAGAHVTSMAVKRVVRRPRPELPGAAPLVRTAGRHSFPSSHATSSVAAVVACGRADIPQLRHATDTDVPTMQLGPLPDNEAAEMASVLGGLAIGERWKTEWYQQVIAQAKY